MQGGLKDHRLIGILFVFGCALTFAGCGEGERSKVIDDNGRVIDETRRNLKDPDSAKFGEVVVIDIGEKDEAGNSMRWACVTVNAKNSYGGYEGDQQAILTVQSDKVGFVHFRQISHEKCIKEFQERKELLGIKR